MRRVGVVVVAAAVAVAGVGRADADGGDVPPAMSEDLAGEEAVAALDGPLGAVVRAAGGDVEALSDLLLTEPEARLTPEGVTYLLDVAPPPSPEVAETAVSADQQPTWPAPMPSGYTESGVPIHHSLPGAPYVVYLDFDGEQDAVNWRDGNQVMDLVGVTIDDDATTLADDEQELISNTWGRVAEDFILFNVDVTTERPAALGTSAGYRSIAWAMVVAGDSFEEDIPGLLGIAPYNPGSLDLWDRPGYIYWDRVPDYLGGVLDSSLLADVISHEVGHMFGLAHDGTSTLEYYGGHGDGPTSWGPIMGLPVGRNVTQWSAGGYPDANNHEPDLGLLTEGAVVNPPRTYRLDDAGDDFAAASTLSLPASGIVTEPGDVDVYRLPLVREAHIEVTPFRAGGLTDAGNLDVAFDVIDASGALVATADPQKLTSAAVTVELPLEPHYLRVRASHDPDSYPLYGSLGQYTITATLRSVSLTGFSEPMPTDKLTAGQTVPVRFGVTGPVAGARVRLDRAGTTGSKPLAETACNPLRNGLQNCLLRVPRELDEGQYTITAEIQDIDGNWFAPVAAGTNPITVNLR